MQTTLPKRSRNALAIVDPKSGEEVPVQQSDARVTPQPITARCEVSFLLLIAQYLRPVAR